MWMFWIGPSCRKVIRLITTGTWIGREKDRVLMDIKGRHPHKTRSKIWELPMLWVMPTIQHQLALSVERSIEEFVTEQSRLALSVGKRDIW